MPSIRPALASLHAITTDRPMAPNPQTATEVPALTLAILLTLPYPVLIAQPIRQASIRLASRGI